MESVYVFRAGPLAGDSDPLLYWYATIPDTQPPIIEPNDERGLAEVARRFAEHERWCEPELAPAGKPLGFQGREPVEGEAMVAAILWLTVAFWDRYREIEELETKNALLVQSANLWDQRHDATSVIELRMKVSDTIPDGRLDGERWVVLAGAWGMFVFDSRADMEAFQRATRDGDAVAAGAFRRLHMHWDRGPERQQAMMRRAYGTEVTPVPSHADADGERRLDDTGAWLLAAILGGVSDWLDARAPIYQGAVNLVVATPHVDVEFLRAYVERPGQGIVELSWAELGAEP
jgi:hypothetical protein